jgi:transposase-like protein
MNCLHCQASETRQYTQTTSLGYAIFGCHSCGRRFNERTGTAFNYLQFPTDIVLLVVLWRLRYKVSLRDLTEMFLVRGYAFTHEAVREWEERFAPLLSAQLKAKRRGQAGKSWYVDETYVKINGQWHYLYRAIDRDGNLVDTMLSATRDLVAAKAFLNKPPPPSAINPTASPPITCSAESRRRRVGAKLRRQRQCHQSRRFHDAAGLAGRPGRSAGPGGKRIRPDVAVHL